MTTTRTRIGQPILTLTVLALVLAGSVSQVLAEATIGGVGVDSTLVFTDPTETVGPTATIPVQMMLSLAGDSAAITTDASGNVNGLTAADITPWLFGVAGVDLDTDTLNTFLTEGIGCSNTFTATCTGGPPYDFAFNGTPPTIIFPADFTLNPGNSLPFLFGTFTPTGGTAPAGTYTMPYVTAEIGVQDDSLAGDPLIAFIDLADTGGETPFTRTVTGAAPEPGTWALALTGLALIGRKTRRKFRVAARTKP